MKCHIISIGNELLIGDTVNTNASWLGEHLTSIGVEVTEIHTLPDDLTTIMAVLEDSLSKADLVITTGGLGPTHDDITKVAVSELFDCEMELDEEILDFIKKTFKKRNIPFSKSNRDQAMVPECCEVMFNSRGTAPGMWFEREKSSLAVLPGVPHEMKHLFENQLLDRLKPLIGEEIYRESRYIVTAGIGESTLSDQIIGDLDPVLPEGVSAAYLPSPQGTKIRISAYGSSEKEIADRVDPVIDYIEVKASDYIIGEGKGTTLSKVIGDILRKKELMIATAESCTGGYISNAITDIPGSSDYFRGGVNAYSNEVKHKILDVSRDDLEKYGAVSKPVALQMAKGVAQNLNTDIGISTTGIAGPTGGTEEKPVGTVWIGFWSQEEHFALLAHFTDDRLMNKERTSAVALETVRRELLQIEEMPYGLKKHSA